MSAFISGLGQGAATGAAIGSVVPGIGTAIGAGVGAVVGGIGGIFKGRKRKKAKERAKEEQEKLMREKQKFQIPDEIKQNQQNAKNEAFGKPAIMRHMEEAAAREQAQNVGAVQRYATSGADALAAVAGVNQQAAAGMNQAAIAGAEARQRNMGALYQANSQMADYKSMAWDMNVNIPFMQRMQFSQDMARLDYNESEQDFNQLMGGMSQVGQMAIMGGNFGGGGPRRPARDTYADEPWFG